MNYNAVIKQLQDKITRQENVLRTNKEHLDAIIQLSKQQDIERSKTEKK